MSKYRFKTKEEFIRDGLWRENHPYTWNHDGAMNKYLGQDIPEALNDKCDKGVGFNYEGWSFSSNNYVLKENYVGRTIKALVSSPNYTGVEKGEQIKIIDESLKGYKLDKTIMGFEDMFIEKPLNLSHWELLPEINTKTPVDMKAIQEEAKKIFPIGCRFYNTEKAGPFTLQKDVFVYEIRVTNIWAHHGCGCLYQDGKWAELISLPEPVSINEFKEGDYIENIIGQSIYSNNTLDSKKELFIEEIPEYVVCVKKYGKAKIGTIYKTSDNNEADKLFTLSWKEVLIEYQNLGNEFIPSTKEAYEAQLLPKRLTKKDLVEGEIYLYDNDHIAVYPEGHSFSIKSKIYDSNPKWLWILSITHATEEQKALLRSEIEKNNTKTPISTNYVPQVGDYVVMEKAGGWSYSTDNNGCIAIVEKVSSKTINHLGSVSSTVPSIDGTVINPKSLNCINFTDVPMMGYSKERIFRKALPHEIPSNLPKKDVIKKSESPLEICRQKYKKGMVVQSAKDDGMYSETFTINVDPKEFTITGGDGVDYFRSEGFLYLEGKYAEILSYPDEPSKIEYSNSEDSVSNKITIQKETFIENVQSVDIDLVVKKKRIIF